MSLVTLKTELRQELKLTPQLLQSMEVLQMNSQELLEYLGRISEEKIAEWIGRHYNLRPAGMIEQFRLRQPIYRQAAGNGSFGRTDVRFPWEEISQEALEDLRSML